MPNHDPTNHNITNHHPTIPIVRRKSSLSDHQQPSSHIPTIPNHDPTNPNITNDHPTIPIVRRKSALSDRLPNHDPTDPQPDLLINRYATENSKPPNFRSSRTKSF